MYQNGTKNSILPVGLRTVVGENFRVSTQFCLPITSELDESWIEFIVPEVNVINYYD